MSDMTVATTILQHLGGQRFVAMTGAKQFVGSDTSLRFRLSGGGGFTKGGINLVQITLSPDDTYALTFSTIRKMTVTVKATVDGIYNDQLRDVFTRVTGLQTSLGTMGGRS